MKKYLVIISICLIFGIFIILFNQSQSLPQQKVELASCVDGDTARFYIDGENVKVRFLAIDTPESTNTIEPYGEEASSYTCKALTEANEIILEFEPEEEYDKYGRRLAWIFIDKKLLQEELIKESLAEVKYIYNDYKYTNRLYKAQNKVKVKKEKIWSN